MKEIEHVGQNPGEPLRRWFNSLKMDLYVWYEESGEVLGFQLCYGKGQGERAVTWIRDRGFTHRKVDDGEDSPDFYKMTPLLVPDGTFARDQVLAWFREESKDVDPEIVEFVAQKLAEYPEAEG